MMILSLLSGCILVGLFLSVEAEYHLKCENDRMCDMSSISIPALSKFSDMGASEVTALNKLYATLKVSVGTVYIGRKQALRFVSGNPLRGSQTYTFYGSFENVKKALTSLTYKPDVNSLENSDILKLQIFREDEDKSQVSVEEIPIKIEIYPRYKISTSAVPDGYLDVDEGAGIHVPVTLNIPNVPKSTEEFVEAAFEVQSGILNIGPSCQQSRVCTFDQLRLPQVAAMLEGLQYVAPTGLNGIMIIDPLKIILRSKTRIYVTDMAFYMRILPIEDEVSVSIQNVIVTKSNQLLSVFDHVQIHGRNEINCQMSVDVNASMIALLSIPQANFYKQYYFDPQS